MPKKKSLYIRIWLTMQRCFWAFFKQVLYFHSTNPEAKYTISNLYFIF